MPSIDPPCGPEELVSTFGKIDIYVFDQLLRGRITPDMRVLDAGCGGGRNSHYLLRCGADVHGVDGDADRIDEIRQLAARHAPSLPLTNFSVGRLDALPFESGVFDAVICCAVLHFAETETEFERMVEECWRTLRAGGVFFARLASNIGIEGQVEQIRERWHRLPDGTERFLVDEVYLGGIADQLGAAALDPLKTTNVGNLRAMTTWVLRKDVLSGAEHD